MIRIFAVLALLASTTVSGEPAIPDTPAGRVLAAWLTSFNSADAAQLEAFRERYKSRMPVENVLGLREATGGLALLRIEKSEPLSMHTLLKEKESYAALGLKLEVSSADQPLIQSLQLFGTALPAEFAPPRLTQAEALQALTATADELARRDRFAGAVLVARHGEVILQKCWGLAERDSGQPVVPDTRFRLGSMNKMFTAIAILQLVEAGRLQLEGTIGRYLPDYPNKDLASKVTVRHLLTHTGGTGDIFGPEFEANRGKLREHRDYLELYGSRGLEHPPGAEDRYSNYGFVLLGALIERASGMSYYEYVRSRIFQPAGMESTGSLPESVEVPGRALGYMREQGAWVSNAGTLPYRGMAAGGGYSTVGDMLRFALALESGRLISVKMLAEATRPQNNSKGYGYGFVVSGEGSLRSYGHGGDAPGMNAEFRVFPQLGYVITALSNVDPPSASRLVDLFAVRMPAGSGND